MIGIVIVSYRSDDRTVSFVREQLSRVSEPHRIVVVDNGASAEEAAALAARIPEAIVIPAENRGFAAGNNLASAIWNNRSGLIISCLPITTSSSRKVVS